MSADEHSPILPQDFGGVVRLFPLPSVVFFPHAILPLHIFEPRYCELLEDALAGDRLISLALLLPGWEADGSGRPAIASVACVGKIISHARLADGRHNIMLAGLRRAAIAKELPLKQNSYRRAKVELLDDFYPASGAADRPRLQQKLLDYFRQLLPRTTLAAEQFEQLLGQHLSLGVLTDIVSFTLNMPLPAKQQLLAEWRVDRRAALLMQQLEQLLGITASTAPQRAYPPEFSPN